MTRVALSLGSAILGNSLYDAAKAKGLPFLTSWRRHGPAKLDELKAKILAAFEQGGADPEAVRKRIDELFQEAEG